MVMTALQWSKLNNNLPPEDRISYAEYLASQSTPIATPTATPTLNTTIPQSEAMPGFINIDPSKLNTKVTEPTPTNTVTKTTTTTVTTTPKTITNTTVPTNIVIDVKPATVASMPSAASVIASIPTTQPIKTAPIDTIQFDNDSVDTNLMVDLLLEDVGGQEILSLLRHDTVNGQEVSYRPIKNLQILQEEYNPNNIIRLSKTSEQIFANFPINLNQKIPTVGNAPDSGNVYLDSEGNLVIEFVNLLSDEQVDVQITTSGTIYEIGI